MLQAFPQYCPLVECLRVPSAADKENDGMSYFRGLLKTPVLGVQPNPYDAKF